MSEGPHGVKNNQNLYLFNSNGKWQSDDVELKIYSFRQNLLSEGPHDVKKSKIVFIQFKWQMTAW